LPSCLGISVQVKKFRNFVIISLLKRVWPFVWTNLNDLYPRMISTTFKWYWSAGSGENINYIFYLFFLLSSLGKRCSSSICTYSIPYLQGRFVQSLVKIDQVILKKYVSWKC
jgi:hypothetical protein